MVEVKYNSSLEAKFYLKEEAPGKDFSVIRERLDLDKNSRDFGSMMSYLKSKGIGRKVTPKGKYYLRQFFLPSTKEHARIGINIRTNKKKLTVKLEAFSEEEIKITDHLDLLSFENYLLTGKID